MTKNTKVMIGVGVGILLLLWLRNRKKSNNSLKMGGASSTSEDETQGGGGGGAIGGGGGGGISPNAIGGANTVITPLIVAVPSSPKRPFNIKRGKKPTDLERGRINTSMNPLQTLTSVDVKPLPNLPSEAQPVSTKADTSFAKFDGSFRSPSGLDFDGHIED
jgi:hypothetical protein